MKAPKAVYNSYRTRMGAPKVQKVVKCKSMSKTTVAAVNPFETAKVIQPKAAAKKGDKGIVEITGLELVAALDAAEKAIKSLKTEARAGVDDQIRDHFISEGIRTGRQPDNFRGQEGKASASCELRKRSTASALTEVEVALLTENGITTEVIEDKTETYIINPSYLADSELMGKVAKLLAGNVPLDFIQKQTSQKKTVVTDVSVIEAFRSKNLADLIKVVGTIALKPKIETELATTFKLIAELVE
jgi:hypothetical protein